MSNNEYKGLSQQILDDGKPAMSKSKSRRAVSEKGRRKSIFLLGLLASCSSIAGSLYAQDSVVREVTATSSFAATATEPVSMSLEDFEALAINHNPTLRQLGALSQKAAGFRTQVGLRPNPTIGYQGQQLADRGTDQHLVFIEQQQVTGGKLELNRRVLNEAVRVQNFELETQRFRVLTDVRTKFYETLAAQRSVEIITEFLPIATKGYEVAELRFKAKESSRIDSLQSKILKNEIELDLQQATVSFEAARRELTALTGTSELAPARLIGTLPDNAVRLDWNQTLSQVVAGSPEYSTAQAAVNQARAELDRQLVQPIPNVAYQFGAGVDNGTNSGMMNVQIGIPVPIHNKNQGNISAARAEYCRAVMELQRIEYAIQARLALVSGNYDSAAAAVSTYSDQILPSAGESLELAELAYKAGETSFLQVLVARQTYFDTQLKFIESQSRLAQAAAQVDGFVLSGGLDSVVDHSQDASLRDLTFGQQ